MKKTINDKRNEFIKKMKECNLLSNEEINQLIVENDELAKHNCPIVYDFNLVKIRYGERFGIIEED